MKIDNSKNEKISKAIRLGEKSRENLISLQNQLNMIEKWKISKVYYSKSFVNKYKKAKIEEIIQFTEKTKIELEGFRQELKGVEVPTELKMEINVFSLFIDFFLDGKVPGFFVEREILAIKEQITDAIYYVERIIAGLQKTEDNNA